VGPVLRRPSGHLAFLRAAQSLPDTFWSERQRRQAHPNGLGNGVGNGWRRGHQAALAKTLGPVWSWSVSVFPQDAPQVGREARYRGDAVAEQEPSVLVDRLEGFLCGLLS
jgi:hypothetical protein